MIIIARHINKIYSRKVHSRTSLEKQNPQSFTSCGAATGSIHWKYLHHLSIRSVSISLITLPSYLLNLELDVTNMAAALVHIKFSKYGDFGAWTCIGSPSKRFNNSPHGINFSVHLRSFRNRTSDVSAPTQANVLDAGETKYFSRTVKGSRIKVLREFAGPSYNHNVIILFMTIL